MTDRLPDKPSDLILLSLDCLEQVEADERYVVDITRWHSPFSPDSTVEQTLAKSQGKDVDKVEILTCMGGSILVKVLGVVPSDGDFYTDDLKSLPERAKLRGLDEMLRQGDTRLAFDFWELSRAQLVRFRKKLSEALPEIERDGQNTFRFPRYRHGCIRFKQMMIDVAALLREMGL